MINTGRRIKWLGLAIFSTIVVFAHAHAQTGSILSAEKPTIESDAATLAHAQRATHDDTIATFLQSRGVGDRTLSTLTRQSSFAAPDGKTFVRYGQKLNGLRIHGALVKAAFDANGDFIHMIDRLAAVTRSVDKATLSESEALRIAIDSNFAGAPIPSLAATQRAVSLFAGDTFFHQAPSVERVIIASGGGLQEGFLVVIWSADDNLLYHTLVNGLGKIVENELRTANDQYRIFPVNPAVSPQQIHNGPGATGAQSPDGWLTGAQGSILIQGNNVRAYLDRDNNNTPDNGGVAINNGKFLASANLSQHPTNAQNQDVAVQNLFYINNRIHDELYRYGFVEGAGNFQEKNFGRGGRGSDRLNAEAQDSGSKNNANFATPSDGSSPRMQMYLWNRSNPERDGDLDSDIIWHEYGHGLTWRMIGSMSGDVSGAIGEGMSDVLAIAYNNDDRVAEYSINRSAGIRSQRYGGHPDTIGDFDELRGVHRNGEIIAATMWDMWRRYQGAGFSRFDFFRDVIGGMNFIAPGPDYFNMRDGFLAQAPSGRDCLIWGAFAARGMGPGGSMNASGSSITEDFSTPAPCPGNPSTPGGLKVGASIKVTSAGPVFATPGGAQNGQQPVGRNGVIVDGPGLHGGNLYWRVDFASGPDGWFRQYRLSVTSAPTAPPPKGYEVGASIKVTNAGPVFATPGGAQIGQQPVGRNGVIVDGPGHLGGNLYWRVDFASGPDGWIRQYRLTVSSPPTPPPPNGYEIGASIKVTNAGPVFTTPGGAQIGQQPVGRNGVIVDGPGLHGGNLYWRVDFASGPDGWFRQYRLTVTAGP